jgi:AcrR family transcriptional regulator
MSEPSKSKRRDPDGTRSVILAAARSILANDGREGLSVSQVARAAGVNRGTAYQHFKTRDELLRATTESVSEQLLEAVFEHPDSVHLPTERMMSFAAENPQLIRAWFFEILSAGRADRDPFWRRYRAGVARFAASELAVDDVDPEALAALMLPAALLWPLFLASPAATSQDEGAIIDRYSRELFRLMRSGAIRSEAAASSPRPESTTNPLK